MSEQDEPLIKKKIFISPNNTISQLTAKNFYESQSKWTQAER